MLGGQAIYPIPSHPWQRCSAETRTFRFFGWCHWRGVSPIMTHDGSPSSGALRLPCDPPDPQFRADPSQPGWPCPMQHSARREKQKFRFWRFRASGFVSRKKSGLSRAQPQLKTWPSPGSLSYWFACMRATTVSDEADRALPRIAECPLQLNTKHA